jgi:hypothetical protein
MSPERDAGVPDYDTDAADLADEIGRIVGSGRVRAVYASGERLPETYGTARLVSVGVMNSDLLERGRAATEEVYGRIADAAAAWLRRRGLLVPGTLISIGLGHEVDLVLVSWARGTGGTKFWIGDDGKPTMNRPLA